MDVIGQREGTAFFAFPAKVHSSHAHHVVRRPGHNPNKEGLILLRETCECGFAKSTGHASHPSKNPSA